MFMSKRASSEANPSVPIKFLWKTMSNDNSGINIYYNAWALKVVSLLKKSCILFYVWDNVPGLRRLGGQSRNL